MFDDFDSFCSFLSFFLKRAGPVTKTKKDRPGVSYTVLGRFNRVLIDVVSFCQFSEDFIVS